MKPNKDNRFNLSLSIFPFLLVISIFLFINAKQILSFGMFMDGLLYAGIAKNLAHGLGTFWYPYLSETLFPQFHEHPPLAIGILSVFYSFFGDSYVVEKLYGLLTLIITSILIAFVWKNIGQKMKHAWMPLFFLIVIPIIAWSSANNMLENTLMMFTTLSVLLYIKSIKQKNLLLLILSGLALSLAFLSKGFVAFFPWTLPFFWRIFNKQIQWKILIVESFILIASTIIPLILLIIFSSAAADSLEKYISGQVLNSVLHVKTVSSRFFILKKLFFELIPCLLVIFILTIRGFIFKFRFIDKIKKRTQIYTFLCLGLSGVLPIMISQKQSGFYMLAALPYFALSFAIFAQPMFVFIIQKIKSSDFYIRVLQTTIILQFIFSVYLAANNTGKINRDEVMINDCFQIMETVPSKEIIGVCPETWSDWSLHGYFARYSNISLDPDTTIEHKYFINPDICLSNVHSKYTKADSLKTVKYHLYRIVN